MLAIRWNRLKRNKLKTGVRVAKYGVRLLFVCLSYAIASNGNSAKAQNITLDGSLGPAQTLTGPRYYIPQAAGQTVGNNLFHSFGQFNLNTFERAIFQSNFNIENIFSRVTGGSPSYIDGRIITTSYSTNLFLMNPSGIVFGPNASIDVGGMTRGSFVATTADAIQFGSTGAFVASTAQRDVALLTVQPSAFFFNQIAAASLTSQAPLEAYDGQSLLFVGGNVSLNGGLLTAPGGRVELGGVAGAGTVGLNIDGNSLRLSFPDGVERADVSLSNGSEVNVAAGGGGSIALNARNIEILQGSGLRAGISPFSGSDAAIAGDVTLNATGTTKIENGFIYNAVFDSGTGGDLRINTGQLIVQDGVVATATVSQGNAGTLSINAEESVEITGSPSSNGTVSLKVPAQVPFDTFFGTIYVPIDIPFKVPIGLFAASLSVDSLIDSTDLPIDINAFAYLLPQSGGDAGDLTINTRRLIVRDGAVVSAGTASEGRAGDLTVNASEFVELSGTSPNDAPPGTLTIANRIPSGLRNETSGLGPGGNLTINTRQLIVRDGAWVSAGTAGEQPGGNLSVNASESVEISGTASANALPSVLAAGTQGTGKSGDLTISTRRFVVRDGAVVSAGTSNAGQGGNLSVTASESVELIGTSSVGLTAEQLEALVGASGVSLVGVLEDLPFPSGLITGTASTGNAGNLTINTGRLLIQDGAQASVSTTGAGNAGRLTVRAAEVELAGTSSARQSPNAIVGSSLLTTAVSKEATGNGGDLDIQTGKLTIRDGAEVSASTLGQGNGANIEIEANSVSLSNGARLSAETSGNGRAGNISVQKAGSVSVSNSSISTAVNSEAVGEGGDITIEAGSVALNNDAQLSASTSGQGSSGKIQLNLSNGQLLVDDSSISTAVNSQAVGEGGDITIEAGSVALNNHAQLSASTSGQGSSGKIQLNLGNGQLLVDDSSISTAVNSQAIGDGDNITIEAGSVALNNHAQLSASTSGQGSSGKIQLNLGNGQLLVDDSSISTAVNSQAVGDGGDVSIAASSVAFNNGAQLRASTSGQGDAGNIQVDTTDSVNISGTNSGLFTNTVSSGKGGDITVNTHAFRLNDGAVLNAETSNVRNGGDIAVKANTVEVANGAVISSSTWGQGDAGTISVQADDAVSVTNNSQIRSAVELPAQGNGNKISITARSLSLTNGAQLSSSTSGQGNAGDIEITTSDSVNLSGTNLTTGFSSGLFTNTSSVGKGGNITVETGAFRIWDGALLNARTTSDGKGGAIAVTADTFNAATGGQLISTTAGSGQAGQISVNAPISVTLSGSDSTYAERLAKFGRDVVSNEGATSGLFVSTSETSQGKGGDLTITTDQLNVRDGAQVNVSSLGTGNAGSLTIEAGSIILDNQGKLQASTASGEGGNINLQVEDLILMRRNSLISARAENNGNGGNITINAPFILAVPSENSDIIANAFRGRGGNITITTNGIYGLEFRPQLTPLSDINASSQYGVNGTVQINTPGVDPTRGLTNLPTDIVDASNQIAQNCQASGGKVASNEFIVTGRGGLPENPGDTLSSDAVWTDLRNSAVVSTTRKQENLGTGEQPETSTSSHHPVTPSSSQPPIVEANGWVINDKGEVVLVAAAPTITPHSPSLTRSQCHVPQTSRQ